MDSSPSPGKYILYGGPFTRAFITEMVFHEGNIDYELRQVDLLAGEHRSEEYRAISPTGWVPVVITPAGETLVETPAINLHIAEQHRITELVPEVDDQQRGAFLGGLFALAGDLEPIMKRVFFPHRFVFEAADAERMREAALDQAVERLAFFENRLAAGGPFFLDQRYSLVDLTLSYWLHYLEGLARLESRPAARRCLDKVMARTVLAPHFRRIERMREDYAVIQARGGGVT